ncbi:hypothetical protein NKH72_23820 [Mesorhizobium sp. M0955]|uniref:hypothetical protein n=1 Tax=unclassified Mesorhizobium TaxID=325217 RepID=UPI00333C5176
MFILLDKRTAYYEAQRRAARSRVHGDTREFAHWAKVAAEIARIAPEGEWTSRSYVRSSMTSSIVSDLGQGAGFDSVLSNIDYDVRSTFSYHLISRSRFRRESLWTQKMPPS